MPHHHVAIVQLVQRLALHGARRQDGWNDCALKYSPHGHSHVSDSNKNAGGAFWLWSSRTARTMPLGLPTSTRFLATRYRCGRRLLGQYRLTQETPQVSIWSQSRLKHPG